MATKAESKSMSGTEKNEKLTDSSLPNGFAKDEKANSEAPGNSLDNDTPSDGAPKSKVNSSEESTKVPKKIQRSRRSRSKSLASEGNEINPKTGGPDKKDSAEKETPSSPQTDNLQKEDSSAMEVDVKEDSMAEEKSECEESKPPKESSASLGKKTVSSDKDTHSEETKTSQKRALNVEEESHSSDRTFNFDDDDSEGFKGFDDATQSQTARLCCKFLEIVDPYIARTDSKKSSMGELENGSPSMFKPIVKLETLSPSVASPFPRKSANNKSKQNKISKDPAYFKPFEYGWVRELVYRATQTSGNKKLADLYYYSPNNKKFRSAKEISEYLSEINCQELTSENFTFYKEPLGVDDPSKEIIRQSKPTKSSLASDIESPSSRKVMPKPKASATKSTASASSSVTSEPVSPPLTSSTTSTPKIAFKTNAVSKKSQAKRASIKTAIKKRRSAGPDDVSILDETEWSPEPKPQANGVKRAAGDSDDSPPSKRSKGSSPVKGKSPTPASANSPGSSSQIPPPVVSIAPLKPVAPPNYWGVISSGYLALFHAFQYLKVHELLRAACVNQMWRHLATHSALWEHVRMKNTRVRDWTGFGKTLKERGTRTLDLRKMLVPESAEATLEMWKGVGTALADIHTLRRVDLGRCIPEAIEMVVKACPQLESLVALTIRGQSFDASCLKDLKSLQELKLKSVGNFEIVNLKEIKNLTNLKHLAITTARRLSGIEDVLPESLESLELGECSELPEVVATTALPKLVNLRRLRLEKGQGSTCPTIQILTAVASLPNLKQLELINFDVKPGFEKALAQCDNLRTLLIIPTYVTQSATTNHVVMGGVSKLASTLTYFIWGLTLELLRVTDLFIDQVEAQKTKAIKAKKGSGDSIPILKPLTTDEPQDASKASGQTTSQVDILALPKLQKVLSTLLPTTKIKILKVPFSATWRQTVDL